MNRRQFFITATASTLAIPSITAPKTEYPSGPGKLIATGLPTYGSRRYPITVWQDAIEKVRSNRSLAVLGAPESSRLNLEDIAARVTNLHVEEFPGDEQYLVYAMIEPLSTPKGFDLGAMMKKCDLYLTPVGFGIVDRYGFVRGYEMSHWVLANTSDFVGAQSF